MFSEDSIINTTGDTFNTGSISIKEKSQLGGGIALYRSILQKVINVNKKNISKVVDENGEPLVVYHGTSNDFRVFNRNVNYLFNVLK